MVTRLRRAALAAAAVAFLAGCAGKGGVRGERHAPTRIAPEEGVVLLLGRLPCPDPGGDTEAHERSLGDWILGALREESPGIRVVPPGEFRRGAFPGSSFADSPRTGEELLAFLADGEARRRVERLGVRFLVVLDEATERSDPEWDFAAEGSGGGGVFAFSRTRSVSTSLQATVIDARAPARAGVLTAFSQGKSGVVLPVAVLLVVPVPLPPVPIPSATESQARREMGRELARFLEGREDW